ncbi:hypothetical protein GCM10011519_25110 [Marmoricola endophyticus]|uniref:DUF1905 domain-containing protein n=1 Tax=Marmoricola endophyticus TaxID=2040280 RepID=A0A917BM93_9ACTN|nr:DUF1905 domain-containing protein [Marmoricola endophyticus]GGF50116.1 hypothetical protein GCM10011519_25110 [Marmoricola endophyticus]
MDIEISGELWWWRGPAPFHFLSAGAERSAEIAEVARAVTYGWGMVPVAATVGATTWTTSLWPKDGDYLLPVRTAVRRAEGLELGDLVTAVLSLDL